MAESRVCAELGGLWTTAPHSRPTTHCPRRRACSFLSLRGSRPWQYGAQLSRGLVACPPPPGPCRVGETWRHSQLMAAGDPPARLILPRESEGAVLAASSGGFMEPSLGGNSQGCFNSLWASLGLGQCLSCWGWEAGGASSCPPALVSLACSSPPAAPTRAVNATPAGGAHRNRGSLSPRAGGQDPVMAPGCPALAPGCPALVPAEGHLTPTTASQVISRPFSLLRALPGAEVQRKCPALGALFSAGMIPGPAVATGGFPGCSSVGNC